MRRILLFLLCVFMGFHACAQAPQLFRYQGRLVENNQLVNDTIPISFKLYDELSGGSLLYEDSASVEVIDGLYATYIGDDTVTGSISNALSATSLYLEITINGQTLSPREQLVSVPYALNAGSSAPSGSILLSTNYPDANLTSQGYAPLPSISINRLDESAAPEGNFEIDFFYGDTLFLKNEIKDLYGNIQELQFLTTTNGISFELFNINSNALWIEDAEIFTLNNQIFAISEESFGGWGSEEHFLTANSTNGIQWNVSTNYSLLGHEIDNFIEFNNQVFAILEATTNKIVRSSDGMQWEEVYAIQDTGAWNDDLCLYKSDDYLHFIQSIEDTNVITRAYSPNGSWWEDTPGGDLPFAPDEESIVLLNGIVWAAEMRESDWSMNDNESTWSAEIWTSTNSGLNWHKFTTLFSTRAEWISDSDIGIYAADNTIWVSLETEGDLYVLSNDSFVRKLNLDSGTSYNVADLNNGTVLIGADMDDDNGDILYSKGSEIKYSDGFYYYIKE